jgi:repressor LexA
MKEKLTDKQNEILNFIRSFIAEKGYPPTLREIGKNFNIVSTFGVKRHLEALKKKGYLNINSYASRAISIAQLSEDEQSERTISVSEEIAQIPVVGRVAAGSPILSEENIEGKIFLQSPFIKKASGCFALKVQGDSMIDAGIYEGDLVIVSPQSTPKSGDIIVARLEGEITVKVFDNSNKQTVLIPKNEKYSPINVTNNPDFFVVGKVIGVLRWYNK